MWRNSATAADSENSSRQIDTPSTTYATVRLPIAPPGCITLCTPSYIENVAPIVNSDTATMNAQK
jgi:hypothetical protein